MPGFDFSNYNRNAALHARGVPLPKATSTGTTIVGCIFENGVVIAADTRATSGPIVADKVDNTTSEAQLYIELTSSELRKTALHLTLDLVRRRRHSCRYRIHNRSNLFQPRTSFPQHWAQTTRRNCNDTIETAPVPLPGTHRRLSRRGRR